MTEILSREKELFQINQELNLMSLNPSMDEGNQLVSRFGTFLKQKGPSTLLKKKLNVESSSNSHKSSGRAPKTHRSPKKSSAGSSPTTPNDSPPPPPLATPRGKSAWTQVTKALKAAPGKQRASAPSQALPIDGSFTRRASHKTATYVKYRNPNFKQSPSLDLLLRHSSEVEPQEKHLELDAVQHATRESTTVVSGQSKKQLTQDNFIRFLKAKVTILEEDHGQLTSDMASQKERLEATLEALRKAESQRDQALNANAKLNEQLHRIEQQLEDTSRCQKERHLERNKQQHELELLRRENKMLKQSNANLEKRLSRSNDDAESARQLLNQQADQQRDELEQNHKDLKLRDNRIKALKRQRADLLNAYKKQLFMIDNLKRQNGCVEQAVAIGFGEKEFNKVLEWNVASKAVY